MKQKAVVTRKCEWNRYCGWVGPLHLGHILQVRMSRPSLVGRCPADESHGFICNRCARRRIADYLPPAARIWAYELCCPLDGELLGRENEWRIVGTAGGVIVGSAERPSIRLFCEALAQADCDHPDRDLVAHAVALSRKGQDLEGIRILDTVPEGSPFHSLSLLLRKRTLEKLKRFDHAWKLQRRLLAAAPDHLLMSVGQLSFFTEGEPGEGAAIAQELLTLVGSRTPNFAKRLLDQAGARSLDSSSAIRRRARESPEPNEAPKKRLIMSVDGEIFAQMVAGIGESLSEPTPDSVAELIWKCGSVHKTLALGEDLARECFTRHVEMLKFSELASVLHGARAGSRSFRGWRATLADSIFKCPLFTGDPSDEVGFRLSVYLDYFVACYLTRQLFKEEKAVFKSTGAAMISQNTALFLSGNISSNTGRLRRLDEWLRMKRQRRSLFRGADIRLFVRNLALVKLMATGEVRGLDLSDADFSGLDLEGSDFRESILTGVNFRRANLRGAIFRDAVVAGVRFEGADLEDAVLETA